jgi:predicted lipoprotein with Yx(FWY)xxD motif
MRISITHSKIVLGLVIGVVAAVVLAACGGGGGDNGNATASDAGSGSGIVSVRSVDGTDVLADSEGRTLYTTVAEKSGRVRCTGGCTSFWDPIGASASESESASADLNLDLGVVKRSDGERQLTFDGRPLYAFSEEGPGELTGDGFVDDFNGTHFEWEAAATGGGSPPAGSDSPSDASPY